MSHPGMCLILILGPMSRASPPQDLFICHPWLCSSRPTGNTGWDFSVHTFSLSQVTLWPITMADRSPESLLYWPQGPLQYHHPPREASEAPFWFVSILLLSTVGGFEHLPCAKHGATHFANVISFQHHKTLESGYEYHHGYFAEKEPEAP